MADELIPGAIAPDYVPTALDVGRNLYCRVTATNIVGAASANAVPVGPISIAAAPFNTMAPVIDADSDPQVGDTVTCPTGTWTGTPPITFAYQWKYFVGPIEDIPGAISASYTLQASEAGTLVYCRVTASNVVGSSSANSNVLGPISALGGGLPVNIVAPVLTGGSTPPEAGQTLTCPLGIWNGTEPITYTYQWCLAVVDGVTGETVTDENGAPVGVPIEGATEPTYVIGSGGTVGTAPINTVAPDIDDTVVEVGTSLLCPTGTWIGTAPITYTYQWYQWDADVDGLPTGTPIFGATSATYTPVDVPVGGTIGRPIGLLLALTRAT